ncbi:MAG: dihydroorotate dehydrogenase electron transfer subunit, partial [Thermoplasmata archaeon]|nr:dihydroorotate dehydrogenase electron transfer subunit [Thermoplasmata archaeon]
AFNDGIFVTSLVGARDEASLLFRGRWEHFSGKVVYSTDDGSFGHPGFITEPLKEVLEGMSKEEISRTVILCCGPEAMMVNSCRVLKEFNVHALFSLERLMKCGIGLCDSCAVSGLRVCADGPVFSCDKLDDIEEFGNTHRDRSGRSVPIGEVI